MVGVAGHRAFLPCDLTPPSAGEVTTDHCQQISLHPFIHHYHYIIYYILFGLTLLNKVVYLVLWYRGDEGEPIYRFSHCDHYSDRHKIDKLICDIKAGLILSMGILP